MFILTEWWISPLISEFVKSAFQFCILLKMESLWLTGSQENRGFIMANGKPGAPKGNQNAKNRTGLAGMPPQMITNQLVKSLKQYEKVRDDDPKKNVKKGQAIRVITDHIVNAAVEGDKWAIEFVTERIEGKAVNRTESQHLVSGQVKHEGLQITFAEPIKVEGEVIEHEPEKLP